MDNNQGSHSKRRRINKQHTVSDDNEQGLTERFLAGDDEALSRGGKKSSASTPSTPAKANAESSSTTRKKSVMDVEYAAGAKVMQVEYAPPRTASVRLAAPKQMSITVASAERGIKTRDPPATGWKPKLVSEGERKRVHWVSRDREIEFLRHTQACEFQDLRKKYGANEVRAWEQYRKIKRKNTMVVSPYLYDADTEGGEFTAVGNQTSKNRVKLDTLAPNAKRPPAAGWQPKFVSQGDRIRRVHWTSPV